MQSCKTALHTDTVTYIQPKTWTCPHIQLYSYTQLQTYSFMCRCRALHVNTQPHTAVQTHSHIQIAVRGQSSQRDAPSQPASHPWRASSVKHTKHSNTCTKPPSNPHKYSHPHPRTTRCRPRGRCLQAPQGWPCQRASRQQPEHRHHQTQRLPGSRQRRSVNPSPEPQGACPAPLVPQQPGDPLGMLHWRGYCWLGPQSREWRAANIPFLSPPHGTWLHSFPQTGVLLPTPAYCRVPQDGTNKRTAQIQVKQENHLLYSGPWNLQSEPEKRCNRAAAQGSGCRKQSLAPLALGAVRAVRRHRQRPWAGGRGQASRPLAPAGLR